MRNGIFEKIRQIMPKQSKRVPTLISKNINAVIDHNTNISNLRLGSIL